MPGMDDAALLARLPEWAFAVALLIARIGGACMLLPGIGEMELPSTIRAGITLALVALLLPVEAPLLPLAPPDAWRGFAMVGAELGTGLFIGWLARLVLLSLPLAGQIIASMVGLANVLQPDPMLGPQTSVLARALGMAAPVAVLATGMHALPLAALAGSYRIIPPGQLLSIADGTAQSVAAVGTLFSLALQLAAPFVLAALVWQVALGLLARLVPHLQVHFAAIPGQIIGGVALLAVFMGLLVQVWLQHAQASFSALPGH